MIKKLVGLTLLMTMSNACFAATFSLDRLIADPAILGKIINKHKILHSLKAGRPVNITKRGKLIVYPDGRISGTGSGGAIFDSNTDVLQIGHKTFCNSHVCTGFQENIHFHHVYQSANKHANAMVSATAATAISEAGIAGG